jgi:hypothetical protein
MHMLQTLAAALVTAVSMAGMVMPASALPHGGTSFDLGVNTGRVAFTAPGVGAYLATLPADSRSIVLSSCTHYLTTPNAASSQDTLDFCSLALNDVANGTVRTFASVAPLVAAPAAPQWAPSAPTLRPNCALPHYTVDPTDPCY